MLGVEDETPNSFRDYRRAPPFVKLASAKSIARNEVPPGPLRDALLSLPDRLSRVDFLCKVPLLIVVGRAEQETTALALQRRAGVERLLVVLEAERLSALGLEPKPEF